MTRTYAQASRSLLRNSLLDGLRGLLVEKDWSAVRMSDVAAAAGVSRQTVYNEFGTRYGLAQAYAQRLAAQLASIVRDALASHPDDIHGALHSGFTEFFTGVATDPMVASLLAGEANPDLLKLITTDAAPLITTASDILQQALTESSWLSMSDDDALRIARAITRMALSYVAMPPEGDRDVAADVASIIGPAIEAVRT
ncbi:putative TetR family transcriptional regulator [Gordonia araii NBRC 100433]|uniref:Putative TetR family transcriptional regulator n=1 Tax=Gordonia araii NBRC 100433 TaxID=1073574 RepID=G7H1Q8_9ACTN|nr:TetR family transcriptional regulator [Gordonia araii]NNG99225.1 TetR/AcrR family transcriptional regulator [Gordonia araii NBRC 100433]GAB09783.1 putative TetR family transcriptional regulator [Gordonia araii NBRC 100433]